MQTTPVMTDLGNELLAIAKMGRPDREVVAIIGDGGFQMTIQELGNYFSN
jgi:TPP-dependent 2-oxoacid decarboxylase